MTLNQMWGKFPNIGELSPKAFWGKSMTPEQHEDIEIKRLKPHQKNPRIGGGASIKQLTQQIKAKGFDRRNRLLVRPLADGFQIVCGHRRAAAAKKAGIEKVPCEVRDLSDEDAYMLLRSDNIHEPLTPIEGGMHFLESGMSRRQYAFAQSLKEDVVKDQAEAARVYLAIRKLLPLEEVGKRWRVLVALRPATPWLWPSWGPRAIREGWTIERTMHAVRDSGHVSQAPSWADAEKMADNLLNGSLRTAQVDAMHQLVTDTKEKAGRDAVIAALAEAKPATLAEAVAVVHRALSGEEPAATVAPAAAFDDVFPPSEPLFDTTGGELTAEGLTLEERYDDHKSRHIGLKALNRFDRALKLPGEPRPDYIGLSRAEREHRCEQIDRLIGWLEKQKRELKEPDNAGLPA